MKPLVVAATLVGAAIVPASAEPVSPVAQHLREGFEIKAAFYDNSGGAYLVLQRGTSAYLCHSSPNQVCEKLN